MAAPEDSQSPENKADIQPALAGSSQGEPLGVPAGPSREYIQSHLPGYEVFEALDSGAQGYVYRAMQLSTKRIVAIKIMRDGPLADSERRRRFHLEIEILKRLRHLSITSIYDSGCFQEFEYYVMDFIQGFTIDSYVTLENLDARSIAGFIAQACRAIGHAHEHGVIHRDLKPNNIMIDMGGHPWVLDFGLAKDLGRKRSSGHVSLTFPGMMLGTLPFLSPEQSYAYREIDQRTDVYALGVTLYYLLAGRFPFTIDARGQHSLDDMLTRTPLPLARTAGRPLARLRQPGDRSSLRDLDCIVSKALRGDPNQRYQSVVELADDLECFRRGEAVRARAGHRLHRLRLSVHRQRRNVLTVVVCLLLTGIVGVGLVLRDTGAPMVKLLTTLRHGEELEKNGRWEEAAPVYEAALRGLDELEFNTPVDREHQFDGLRRIARFSLRTGRRSEAEALCARMWSLAEAEQRRDPGGPVALMRRAQAHDLFARMAEDAGESSTLIQHLDSQIDHLESLMVLQPGNDVHRSALLAAHIKMSECQRQAMHSEQCRHHAVRAYQISRAWCKEHPDDPAPVVDMCVAALNLGAWHLGTAVNVEHLLEASHWFREAAQPLARFTPTQLSPWLDRIRNLHGVLCTNLEILTSRLPLPHKTKPSLTLAALHRNIALAYSIAGAEWSSALPHLEEELRTRVELVRRDPDNVALREDLSIAHRHYCNTCRELRRRREAEAHIAFCRAWGKVNMASSWLHGGVSDESQALLWLEDAIRELELARQFGAVETMNPEYLLLEQVIHSTHERIPARNASLQRRGPGQSEMILTGDQ